MIVPLFIYNKITVVKKHRSRVIRTRQVCINKATNEFLELYLLITLNAI